MALKRRLGTKRSFSKALYPLTLRPSLRNLTPECSSSHPPSPPASTMPPASPSPSPLTSPGVSAPYPSRPPPPPSRFWPRPLPVLSPLRRWRPSRPPRGPALQGPGGRAPQSARQTPQARPSPSTWVRRSAPAFRFPFRLFRFGVPPVPLPVPGVPRLFRLAFRLRSARCSRRSTVPPLVPPLFRLPFQPFRSPFQVFHPFRSGVPLPVPPPFRAFRLPFHLFRLGVPPFRSPFRPCSSVPPVFHLRVPLFRFGVPLAVPPPFRFPPQAFHLLRSPFRLSFGGFRPRSAFRSGYAIPVSPGRSTIPLGVPPPPPPFRLLFRLPFHSPHLAFRPCAASVPVPPSGEPSSLRKGEGTAPTLGGPPPTAPRLLSGVLRASWRPPPGRLGAYPPRSSHTRR